MKIVVQRLAKNEFIRRAVFVLSFLYQFLASQKKRKEKEEKNIMEYRYPLSDGLEDLWPKFRPGFLYVSLKLEYRKDLTMDFNGIKLLLF